MAMGVVASWFGIRLCILNHTLVTPGLSIPLSVLYASCAVGGALLVVYALSMIVNPPPQSPDGAH
jgi:TRAP-type C4-dicarboxylate transport system permease small subunit